MKSIFSLLIIFSLNVNAQKKPYPRQKESEAWINNFKTIQSLTKRIELIKDKIYSDTLYENYKKRIILDDSRGPEKICKTVFVIIFKEKHYYLDLLENPKINEIMKFINDKNIHKVEIMESEIKAMAYYGEEGLCGVVTMYCNNKLGRKLRNVL